MNKYVKIPKEAQKKRGRKPKLKSDLIPEAQVINEAPEAVPAEEAPAPEALPAEEAQAPEALPAAEAQAPEASKEIPNELEDILKEYSEAGGEEVKEEALQAAEAQPAIEQKKVNLVRGYMLLLVLDFVFPAGISFLMRKFGGESYAKLSAKDLRLTDSEFNDLEPIADECAKEVQMNVSPIAQLIIGLAVIYSSKLLFLDK